MNRHQNCFAPARLLSALVIIATALFDCPAAGQLSEPSKAPEVRYEPSSELMARMALYSGKRRTEFENHLRALETEMDPMSLRQRLRESRDQLEQADRPDAAVLRLIARDIESKIDWIAGGAIPHSRAASRSPSDSISIGLRVPDWRRSDAFKTLGDLGERQPPSQWMRTLERCVGFPYTWQRAALTDERAMISSLQELGRIELGATRSDNPIRATVDYAASAIDTRIKALDAAIARGEEGPQPTVLSVEGPALPRSSGVGTLSFGPVRGWTPTVIRIHAGEMKLERLPILGANLNAVLADELGDSARARMGLPREWPAWTDPERVAVFEGVRATASGSTRTSAVIIDGVFIHAMHRVLEVADPLLAPRIGAKIIERCNSDFGEASCTVRIVPEPAGVIAAGTVEWRSDGARIRTLVSGMARAPYDSSFRYEQEDWRLEPDWIGLADAEVREAAGIARPEQPVSQELVLAFIRATPLRATPGLPPLPVLHTPDGQAIEAQSGALETLLAYCSIREQGPLADFFRSSSGDTHFREPCLKWVREQRMFNPFDHDRQRQARFLDRFRDGTALGVLVAYGPIDPSWTWAELRVGGKSIPMRIGKMGTMTRTTLLPLDVTGPLTKVFDLAAEEGKYVRLGPGSPISIEAPQFAAKRLESAAAEARAAKAAEDAKNKQERQLDDLLR